MSISSELVILRNTQSQCSNEDYTLSIKDYQNDELDKKMHIPEFIKINEKSEKFGKWINCQNHNEYEEIISTYFNSSFLELINFLNLDGYVNTQIEFLDYTSFKIKQALDYLILEEYNKNFEMILNNEMIKILGENYIPYQIFLKTINTKNKYELEQNNSAKYYLNDLRNIFSTYLFLNHYNKNFQKNYSIIYNCYA